MQPKYRAPFLTQFSPFILLWPFRLYHKKIHIISTNTETSVLSMHCAGTQDATYATWSHLDHTCTYVMNMIAQFLAALQPGCEKMKSEWENEEKMKREWENGKEIEREILKPNSSSYISSVSKLWKFLFADATALARDFVDDRQFNLGSPRMILTNVSLTIGGIEKLLSNENISLEQSYNISCRYCWAWCYRR